MRRSRLFAAILLIAAWAFSGCAADQAETGAAAPRKTAESETPAAPVAEVASQPEEKAAAPAGRQWKDPAGKTLATGQFVSLLEGKVCLETSDGLGAVVPLDALCGADRDFALRQGGASAAVIEEPLTEVIETAAATAGEAAAETGGEMAAALPAVRAESYSREKVVIPFDFVSEFDNGRYGGMIGEMIVAKIRKEGRLATPDAITIRDVCAENRITIAPQTPIEEIGRVLRDLFDAQIAVWGSCERAPGEKWDVYDLTIKCADFSAGPRPKVLYEKTNVRTKTVSEIPHLYVKEMLDALHGREPGEPPPPDAFAEQNWQSNPNLVDGGDFEKGLGGAPLGWEDRGGQEREPLGRLVQWTAESGNPANRVIRFTFDQGVGDGYGVMYYSKPFPIDEGAKYRFQCRYRTNGPKVIVFIKCYAEMPSEYQAAGQTSPARHPLAQPGQVEYVPQLGQLRECYRSQQNLKGEKNRWHTHTEDFTPRHTKYEPKWGRVMLYAYLGAGVVEFDDVVLKQIVPASASDQRKAPRHSMESGVTIKEMEENERRAREAREKDPDR